MQNCLQTNSDDLQDAVASFEDVSQVVLIEASNHPHQALTPTTPTTRSVLEYGGSTPFSDRDQARVTMQSKRSPSLPSITTPHRSQAHQLRQCRGHGVDAFLVGQFQRQRGLAILTQHHILQQGCLKGIHRFCRGSHVPEQKFTQEAEGAGHQGARCLRDAGLAFGIGRRSSCADSCRDFG